MEIFGIRIDNLSREAVETKIREYLDEPKFHRITTVNPEFLLLTQKNRAFRGALLSADLSLADGVGIHLPFWLRGEKLEARLPGADLLIEILTLANQDRLSIGLMLAPDGLSSFEAIEQVITERYPHIELVKFSPEYLTSSGPIPYYIVFCNYGAPLQEIMLAGLRRAPGQIRLAMGVGGAFDFLTNQIPRAPRWMQKFGLEWLWRLVQQPKRFKRIWNAVIVFPWKVLSQK